MFKRLWLKFLVWNANDPHVWWWRQMWRRAKIIIHQEKKMNWTEREQRHRKRHYSIERYTALCDNKVEEDCVKHFVRTGYLPPPDYPNAFYICKMIYDENKIPHALRYINLCHSEAQKKMLQKWIITGSIPISDNFLDNTVVTGIINVAKDHGFGVKI